jgi:hypothetical protein
MPKDIITTVYEYHELPTETAKAAAREWLREAVTDREWWDNPYQDAEDVGLKITDFGLYPKTISAEFITSAPEVAETITGNHGKDCATYKAAHDYLRELDVIGPACDAEDGSEERNTWEAKREEVDNNFLKALRKAYIDMLESEYEYLCSIEHLAEFAEANSYTFTAMGRRFG